MKKTLLYSVVLLGVIATVVSAVTFHSSKVSAQISGDPFVLTGWAWSDNIGWISLNCLTGSSTGGSICSTSDYAVSDDGFGNLSGYAWSDSVGWIQFGGLSNFPSNGSSQINIKKDPTTGIVSGWVRALTGVGRNDGWDGWISLSGISSDSSPYGVSFDSSTEKYSGYAWGSDVIGWLSFDVSSAANTTNCIPSNNQVCEIPNIIPAVSLSVSPATISTSTSPTSPTAILSWSSQDVTTCSGSGDQWSGNINSATSSGNQAVGPFSTTAGSPHLYTITCQSVNGPVSASASLTITGDNSVTTINPPSSCPDVANATYCAGSKGTSSTIVNSCTSPANVNLCEFVCSSGFSKIGKICVNNGTVTEH